MMDGRHHHHGNQSWGATLGSWWNRRDRHETDEELRFHVYVNPIGLAAPSWKGICRWEAFVVAGLAGLVLIGFFHLWMPGIVVPFAIILLGTWLTQKHPFWPEVLWRAVLQPIRFLDT
jgi:hypothetical protein